MDWLVIEKGINLFEMFIVMFFLKKQFARERTTHFLDDLIVVIVASVILSYLNHIYDIGSLAVMGIMFLYWTVVGLIRYGRKHILKILLSIIIVDVVLIACEFSVIIIMGLFLKATPMDLAALGTQRFIFAVNSKLLAFLIVQLVHTTKMHTELSQKYQSFILVLMFILNIVISFFITDVYRNYVISDEANNSVLVLSFVVFVCNILVLLISNIVFKAAQVEFDKQLIEISLNQRNVQIDELKSVMELVRRNQHDFKNHLQAINAMVSSDKVAEVKNYLAHLGESQTEIDQSLKSSMTAIELIIQQKIKIAEKKGISVIKEIVIPNNFEDLDYGMAIIIGNSMDNAIEANETVDGEKYIEIKVFVKNGYLNYYIENASSGDYNTFGDKLMTKKLDASLHGFGLVTIEEVVKKHHGIIEIQPMKEKFILKCSLLIEI